MKPQQLITAILFAGLIMLINPHSHAQEQERTHQSQSPSKDAWELQFGWPPANSGETGIESDGNFIYVTNGFGPEIFKYSTDGTYLESFTILNGGTPISGLRDLAYDGTRFYGGNSANVIYEMDFENQQLTGTITTPSGVRAIAYDEGEDAFWIKNWNSDFMLVDRQGSVLNSFPAGNLQNISGLAYDGIHPLGPYLYAFGQEMQQARVVQFALPGGYLTGFTYNVLDDTGNPGDIAAGCAIVPELIPGTWSFAGVLQGSMVFGYELGTTNVPEYDAGVSAIINPKSGVALTADEQITIKLTNYGQQLIEWLDYEVTWDNGSYQGGISYLHVGSSEVVTLPVTADLSEYQSFTFEACTFFEGDENPQNDCKTKVVTCMQPDVCNENLYTSGCDGGHGLTYWKLSNIETGNIPCEGSPAWYHDYTNLYHALNDTMYPLTVKAAAGNTWLDVWIDFNDDMELTADELVIDDAFCATADSSYVFPLNIPDGTPDGMHVMRFRTNYGGPVTDPCDTYTDGNCCDFMASTGTPVYPVFQIDTSPVYETHTPDQDYSFVEIDMLNNSGQHSLIWNLEVEYNGRKEIRNEPHTSPVHKMSGDKTGTRYGMCTPSYSSGCSFGDGLISWELANVSTPIPCEGSPPWYHDYQEKIHFLTPGIHELTVMAGYNDTYFDVWLNFDGNYTFDSGEKILSASCMEANVEYTFEIEIPDSMPAGNHLLRFLTNWLDAPGHPCATYSYGNAADFTAVVGDIQPDEWLLPDSHGFLLYPNWSFTLQLLFHSGNLQPGIYEANLVFTCNDPTNPEVIIPVEFTVLGNNLNPPQNLQVSVTGNDVSMEWDEPEPTASNLLGYLVYLDGEIVSDTVAETSWDIDGCPDGSHWVSVSAVYDDGESEMAEPVHVEIGALAGKLQGFIRDAVTKLNVPSAWISAIDADFGAVSYATPFGSHYSLHLPGGTYTVTCNADGYQPVTHNNVTIPEGGTRTLHFYLEPEGSDRASTVGFKAGNVEQQSGEAITIHPNPAKEMVAVSSNFNILSVRMLDLNGQLLQQINTSGKEIHLNTSKFKPGIYVLEIETENGINMQKLVIQ